MDIITQVVFIRDSSHEYQNNLPRFYFSQTHLEDGWMIRVLWPFQHHRTYQAKLPMKENENIWMNLLLENTQSRLKPGTIGSKPRVITA